MPRRTSIPFVSERNFVLATRDTGYRTPAAALAELVDNALQADASSIQVIVTDEGGAHPGISLAVLDNGSGMDPTVLRHALRFGGSTRFNDRSGPGRYGMGLPNSSVSHARRCDVYSWRTAGRVFHTCLDIDDIETERTKGLPEPRSQTLPEWAQPLASDHGTLIIWSKCDRLSARTASTIARHLHTPLGRVFRFFLWRGVRIVVNAERVRPIDPLFLHRSTPLVGGIPFGKPISYAIRLPADRMRTARVRVRFVELPITEWHALSIDEKRRFGIAKGAGVSVVRADREVAYGWYFMGRKRRENYDDWWRCEVAFEPELDEYFGLTHSKQTVNPIPELEKILVPDIEAQAHTLNARARKAFSRIRGTIDSPAAKVARQRENQLPALRATARVSAVNGARVGVRYRLHVAPLQDDNFYAVSLVDGEIRVTINQEHPFFEKLYHPLAVQGSPALKARLECLLFALARAEVDAPDRVQRYWYRRKRRTWSNVLAAFLGT